MLVLDQFAMLCYVSFCLGGFFAAEIQQSIKTLVSENWYQKNSISNWVYCNVVRRSASSKSWIVCIHKCPAKMPTDAGEAIPVQWMVWE